jgi:putative ATP-binding cassette transporter
MKFLAYLYRNSTGLVYTAVIAGVVSGACSALLLALVSRALADLQSFTRSSMLLFALLCVISPVSRFASASLLVKLGQHTIFDQRVKLSRKILAAPLLQLETIKAHRLMTVLTDDVLSIAAALSIIPLACISIAIVIGCLIYLGWLSWPLLLLVLGFMIVGGASYQLPLLSAIKWFRQARVTEEGLFKDFRAMTEGIKELKLNRCRREAFLTESLGKNAAGYRDQVLLGQNIYIAAASWGQILFFIVIALILFVAPRYIPTSPHVMAGYVITLLYMMNPLEMVLNSLPALGRADVALEKMEELGLSLKAEPSMPETIQTVPGASGWNQLELIKVTHTYQVEGKSDGFTLGPANINLYPGEIVFITGGNGSGKTTLAKILLGLYAPEMGIIRFDGQLITQENLDDYRQNFSAVYSDFYLFEKLLGVDKTDLDRKAQEYLVQLQLQNEVKIIDGTLSNVNLSQGQRKRLALLAAYLEDRLIYVFDEWAADQDPFFKEIFYHQLLPSLKSRGKTVIAITHDDRYYHIADRVIKLEYGQIIHDSKRTCETANAGMTI